MAQNSAIEWTHLPGYTPRTWNPLAGCTRKSEGCDSCYAAGMAIRLEAMAKADLAAGKDPGGKAKYIGTARRNQAGRAAFVGVVNLDWEALNEPATWGKPSAVFVNSMSDIFHPNVPDDFILETFRVMERTPQHTYMVLTKRPERMAEWTNKYFPLPVGIPKHIWCGASTEDQPRADERVPWLCRVPAWVRFLSYEPALGPLNLSRWLRDLNTPIDQPYDGDAPIGIYDPLSREYYPDPAETAIQWVLIGGESGHGARAMDVEWARDLVQQCRDAGVVPFVKQMGAVWARDQHVAGKSLAAHGDTKGHDMQYWPADLRVREFPAVREAVRG